MLLIVLSVLAALVAPAPVHAVSLSGIVLYSADDFGMPSGQDSFDRPENPEAHLWRTLAAGRWYSLVVYEGLPPESLKRRPLNGRNLMIELPLTEGENYFTIVGEPGPITATDQYQRFALNLYFDSELAQPGVSVLFPRYADFDGGPTAANRSLYIYSFSVTPSQVRSPGVDDTGLDFYDDGLERVSVTSASFLSAEQSEISVDQVGPQSVGSSGTDDFIGTVTLLVEPSEGTGTVGGGTGGLGGAPRAAAPRGPGNVAPRGGGAAPISPGQAGGGQIQPQPAQDYAEPRAAQEEDSAWVGGDATPTPRDAINALKNWLQDAVEPTAAATSAAGTPTPKTTAANDAHTRTSRATGPAATATPARTPSISATTSRTQTPAVTPTPTNPRPSSSTTTTTSTTSKSTTTSTTSISSTSTTPSPARTMARQPAGSVTAVPTSAQPPAKQG